MAGVVQVCIEASNERCIHKSASDVACRDTLDQWQYCGQAVKMTHNHWTQCMSVKLAADVMSCTLEKTQKKDCEMLRRAWEGVCRSVWKRVMSFHPQIRMRWCVPYGSSFKQSTTRFQWTTILTQTGLAVPERPKAHGSSY